jgi:hypothetical protein
LNHVAFIRPLESATAASTIVSRRRGLRTDTLLTVTSIATSSPSPNRLAIVAGST